MLTEVTRKISRLAEDIRKSLREADGYFSRKTTKAIVHRVGPKETEARRARLAFGLPQAQKNP